MVISPVASGAGINGVPGIGDGDLESGVWGVSDVVRRRVRSTGAPEAVERSGMAVRPVRAVVVAA
jgi:hypothetical protein